MKNGNMSASGKLSVALAGLLSGLMAGFTTMLTFTLGAEYGIFGVDEVFLDVLAMLGSGTSDYEKAIGIMQIAAVAAFVVLGVPSLISLVRREAVSCAWLSFFGAVGAVADFLILLLYDFDGIVRMVLLILFFVLDILFVVCQNAAAKRGGGMAALLLGLSAALLVSMFLVPIFGWLFTLFGDIVWIVVGACALAGPVYTRYYVVVL